MDAEICIESTSPHEVSGAVRVAYKGGAVAIELCSDMSLDGLTPPKAHICAAREAFQERPGLNVMIRPRAGDFYYSPDELSLTGLRRRLRS